MRKAAPKRRKSLLVCFYEAKYFFSFFQVTWVRQSPLHHSLLSQEEKVKDEVLDNNHGIQKAETLTEIDTLLSKGFSLHDIVTKACRFFPSARIQDAERNVSNTELCIHTIFKAIPLLRIPMCRNWRLFSVLRVCLKQQPDMCYEVLQRYSTALVNGISKALSQWVVQGFRPKQTTTLLQ